MRRVILIASLCVLTAASAPPSDLRTPSSARQALPTGQSIAPLAAPGAQLTRLQTGLRDDGDADAAGAMSLSTSPDGTTLLLLTSGYNTDYSQPDGKPIKFPVPDPLTGATSSVTSPLTQWIFVYTIGADGGLQLAQRIAIPNAFVGLAWAPDSRRFYVSGGIDDRVVVYAKQGDQFVFDPPAIILGHNTKDTAPLPNYDGGINAQTIAGTRYPDGLGFSAMAATLSLSVDGKRIAVANLQNDSVSIADTQSRRVLREVGLFKPGGTQAHGEYPYGVVLATNEEDAMETLYASSLRDGEIDIIRSMMGTVTTGRVELGGAPNALLLSGDGMHLYVANGDLDEVDVIDALSGGLTQRISVDRAGQRYRGANPNALALDDRTHRLYVTLGGENAVAVIDLNANAVVGRIPTSWYPTSVALYGNRLAITDAKSLAPPNPGFLTLHMDAMDRGFNLTHQNQYVLSLEKANLLTMPIPSDVELGNLTRIVDENNGFASPHRPSSTIAALRGKIKHVIYVMKENRTYDQVLGDLKGANGDPRLVVFPYPVTPNHHRLASQFVTLDNFYTSGDVSGDGWNWSQQGRANEYVARLVPIAYAAPNGISYDFGGQNRGINPVMATTGGSDQFNARITTLLDPTGGSAILPGNKDVAATGFIWDSVMRAGKSVRHYGMYTDATYYQDGAPFAIPIVRNAYARRARQAVPSNPSLMNVTDLYYRGWDLNTPDRYRYEEWKREFEGYVRNHDLPAFEAVELMMDHFGQFKTNVAGLNTPYLQIGDNDYALGQLVEAVSHSPYWKDTAIFVLEDDSQAGPDHVSPHRSVAYVISAYTRRHAVVHTPYTTVAMLRTIEDLLGIEPLGIFDANAPDMTDAFSTTLNEGDRYTAVIPGDLCKAPVNADLIPECASSTRQRTTALLPKRNAAWWIAKTRGMNFTRPDAVDARRFNGLLATGLR